MIRSPHALLVSLSLHLLMGWAVLFFVVPQIVSPEKAAVTRCQITLSHVVSMLPVADAMTEVPAKPQQAAARPEKKLPEKTAAVPAVTKPKTVTQPVRTEALPESAEEVMHETAASAAENAEDTVTPAVTAAAGPAAADESKKAAIPVQSSESYLDEHLAVIVKLLQENLYYPKMARKRHIEGEVLAAFTLQTDGTIREVTVKKHARDVLDRAAVRTIESLSGLLPHPQTPLTLEVPIRFVLN